MSIKQKPILTKEDFEQALITLRLSVSEVSRETGIPRHIVSHFRGYGDGMKPEQIAKIRDFFESQGIEFEHEPDTTESATPGTESQSTTGANPIHPLIAMQLTRYVFPVNSNIRPKVLANALEMIEKADAHIADLMMQEAKRNDGFLGDGDLAEETKDTLQDVFSLMASSYLIVRMLRGWGAFGVPPVGDDTPETLRDIVFDTFKPRLVDAGLIESEPAKEDDDEKEAA